MRIFRRVKTPLISMDDATSRAVSRTGARPQCDCLDAQYGKKKWRELRLHDEIQDVNSDAWKRLLDIVDRVADKEEQIFEPGAEIPWEDWVTITTLPPSISRMKGVKEFRLYGSNLVRIPPEIGELTELTNFDVYTSYRLHWFPYEITQCTGLKESRISTRALYGNFKYRAPFPRLPASSDLLYPKCCSVCKSEFGGREPHQCWISLNVATDVVPLLVHACSKQCRQKLPTPSNGYFSQPHKGGLGIAQPSKSFSTP